MDREEAAKKLIKAETAKARRERREKKARNDLFSKQHKLEQKRLWERDQAKKLAHVEMVRSRFPGLVAEAEAAGSGAAAGGGGGGGGGSGSVPSLWEHYKRRELAKLGRGPPSKKRRK